MLKNRNWDSHQEAPVRASLFFAAIISCVHITLGGFACMENPCFHGICIDYLELNSKHQCYCRNGFTGYSCEINWDECRSSPCLNNGICTDGIASFNCTCPENFAGALCQYDLTACEELFPCQNNGTCTIDTTFGNETFSCMCPPGFTGPQCEYDISMCNTTANICMNGGKCIDGVGDTFYCQCEPGWEGEFCQTLVDNCASQPCQSGGICVNKLNDFGCACPFGYTGKYCEKKLRICKVNPCQNDAFCLHEQEDESKFTCYCVPDYHGDLCQWKYDDCSPPPRCFNGGTCIDGVGGFSCSCPQDFFGPTCQCTKDNMTEPICQLNETIVTTRTHIFPPSTFLYPGFTTPSISLEITPSPTMPITFMVSTTEPASSAQDFSMEYKTSVPIFMTSTATTSGLSPSLIPVTPVLESSEGFATALPYSTPAIELVTTTVTTPAPDQHHNFSSLVSPRDETAGISMTPTATKSELGIVTEIPPWQTSKIDLPVSLPVTETATPTPTTETEQPEPSISWEFSTVELQPSMTSEHLQPTASVLPDLSIPASTFQPSITISTTAFSPSLDVFATTPILPSEELMTTGQQLTPTANISITVSPTTSIVLVPDLSSVPHIFASDWSLDTASYPPQPSGTELLLPTSTIAEFSATAFDSLSISSMLSPTPSMEITTPEPTVSISPSPPSTPTSTTNASVTDLCLNYCLNEGKCIADSIEPRCICSFKYFGDRCENPRRKLTSISFSGDSFLEYKAPNNSINRITVKTTFATNVPDSILLYTANKSGRLYGLVFTQGGHITLHFSCGTQSMHFVETRTRVDNGKNFTMEFQLEMVVHGLQASEVHCVGQISLNHSYIMRGEQIVGHNELHENPIQFIYLGGVDAENVKKSDDIIKIMPGLRGCLYALSINGEEKDLFDDAINGKEIAECAAFECVSNPCFGTSKCVPWNKFPYWQCLCPPGFQGPRCQVRVCDSNPCRNGATCTFPSDDANSIGPTTVLNDTANLSTLGSNSICLCPLGFGGLQCQSIINITKPSFKPVLGFDYASYIAYEPIPRFADWVQLKMHFVTRNISQVALILYSGYSNNLGDSSISNPDQIHALSDAIKDGPGSQFELESMIDSNEVSGQRVTDFFAITFVQGYIALTWNLGSGIHRIITPSRIDKRLNVHTLFAGRAGRQAWLKVDGMRNITGKSPGPFHRLNVNSELFLGGYDKFRFEGLPYDLALHKGFEGCIFDFGFRVKNRLYLPKPLRGRSVKNCYEEDC